MIKETRILLIGEKDDGKIIVEMTNSENESLMRVVGKSRNELISGILHHMTEITIFEKPLITNGYRVSQSTGEYVSCKKVSKDLEERISQIIYPKNEINQIKTLEEHYF